MESKHRGILQRLRTGKGELRLFYLSSESLATDGWIDGYSCQAIEFSCRAIEIANTTANPEMMMGQELDLDDREVV
jgi:hypothetical protein